MIGFLVILAAIVLLLLANWLATVLGWPIKDKGGHNPPPGIYRPPPPQGFNKVRPIDRGYVNKGGINASSQIEVRPPPPAPIRKPPSAP